ncbi:hypothetical protein TREMEDRAFT_66277 [Tremella mesenterica DSM 1558]|uniref:uncharacterized protein n=1 Tax=Tremella mesenterica (strain ATCC 24925 / CBS 8224 / DSM 1558 / NBRC 9311 / NRRL Y-6157 / RJB 2259-6 / UBC 559-6) TaxID=578456 RepID=UPI00032D1F13|nr:uncharacterized protein TREMEDRAFT_66277 [Tremella mesenterica DSM 1558]EIW65683.1 hypothetical protein TREMEDRAFT_66277 [Tremella mesenterica DSM 1558]
MSQVERYRGQTPALVDELKAENATLVIEIYNETLRDLLNFKRGPLRDDEKPAIHFSKSFNKGNAGRKTSATDWNERSSRSHSVFSIVIESRPRDGNGDDDIRLSKLSLIDLAGSEKADVTPNGSVSPHR